MNIVTLAATLREHYDTGKYGNAFLIMRADVRDKLREMFGASPGSRDIASQLIGIPVLLDNGCEVAWRLVDRRTGDVLVSDASQT